MKAIKGFNQDMTCRGFQFKEGETYEEAEAKLCEKGFHACERPTDCFNYYKPGTSEFHEVELDDVSGERKDDTKIVGKKIKVGAKLSVKDICALQFEYVKEHTTSEVNNQAANAGNCGAANAGNCGAANAGYKGAANAGYKGAANAGDYGAANAGNCGAANAGYKGAANAGDYGAANAGNCGAANAGNCGAAVSRGSASVGKHGVAIARGSHDYNNRVKGQIGSILVIAEENDDNCEIKSFAVAVVDGEKIKPDVWYRLEDGELVECEEKGE